MEILRGSIINIRSYHLFTIEAKYQGPSVPKPRTQIERLPKHRRVALMQEEPVSETTPTEQPTESEFWRATPEKVEAERAEELDEEFDAEALAASAVAEIDKLMSDLMSAREYLSAEAERVKRETARLTNLSKTAVASVQIIADNLSKWRQNGKQAA